MKSLFLLLALSASLQAAEIQHPDARPLAQAQAAVDRQQWPQAKRQLLTLARRGNPIAMWSLARLLELPTPVRDLREALRWYTRLAEQGAPAAMEATALAHYLGRGTTADAALAADWFRHAANHGAPASQYILATLYEKGEGVAQDLRLARVWYARAAAQGDVAARAKLQALPHDETPLTTPL